MDMGRIVEQFGLTPERAGNVRVLATRPH